MNPENTKTEATVKPKKPYAPPKLVSYGHVRSLTLTGGADGSEGSAMTGGSFMSSDRLIKEGIVRIGMHPLGIGLYLFDYTARYRATCGHGRQFGVMADEVEAVMPQAVSVHPDGHKVVNYRMLGISRTVQ